MFRSPNVHRASAWSLLAAAALLAACGVRKPQGSNADASTEGPAPGDEVRYLEALESPADFARVQGEGGEVKYLGAATGTGGLPPVDRPCMFQNTELWSPCR